MNNAKTLFIFEGGRAEDRYVKKLEQNFLGVGHAIKCVFDAEIYQLYKAIKQDDGFSLDIVALLKERTPENEEALREYTRNSFAYVYLFFDYDGHSSLANDDKIREMLSFFNNETDEGKLYISYPMVEAIRHFQDLESFKYLTVKCKRTNCPYIVDCEDKDNCINEPHYKTFSASDSRPQLSNINSYSSEVWRELIEAHICKANYLVYGTFSLPESLISQESIFNSQMGKYISHKCPKVAVLSAFPLYVLDYYGIENTIKKLNP